MRYCKVIWPALPANAMAVFPFIFFKKKSMAGDPLLINHEKIHFRQQLELLIVPFYLLYLIHYLINLARFRNHDRAYFGICFEKEAYAHDRNLNYLKSRRLYAWLNYL